MTRRSATAARAALMSCRTIAGIRGSVGTLMAGVEAHGGGSGLKGGIRAASGESL